VRTSISCLLPLYDGFYV